MSVFSLRRLTKDKRYVIYLYLKSLDLCRFLSLCVRAPMTPLKHVAEMGYWIGIHCRACDRNANLDPAPFLERYGDASFKLLEQRLTCGRCGEKHPRIWIFFHNTDRPRTHWPV